jgi:hypothetical protein
MQYVDVPELPEKYYLVKSFVVAVMDLKVL